MIDVFVFDKILDLFLGVDMTKVIGTIIMIVVYFILNVLCSWAGAVYKVVSAFMSYGFFSAYVIWTGCNWQKTNLEFYSILVFVRCVQTFIVFVCRHLVLIVKDVFEAHFELHDTLVKWTFILEFVTCAFLVVIAFVAVYLPSGNQTQSLHQTMFELATLEHRLSKWIIVLLIVFGIVIAGYIIVDSYSPVWVFQNFQTQAYWFSWGGTCSGEDLTVVDWTAQAFFSTLNANLCVPSVFRRIGKGACRIEAKCNKSYLVGIKWGHGNPNLNLYQPVHFWMFLNFALILFFIFLKSKRNNEYKSAQSLWGCKALDLLGVIWGKICELSGTEDEPKATTLLPQNAGPKHASGNPIKDNNDKKQLEKLCIQNGIAVNYNKNTRTQMVQMLATKGVTVWP